MIFRCRPARWLWDRTVNAQCIEVSKVYIVMGSLNVLTDILLLCLPLPQLWKLQMHMAKKLQAIGIFSSGSLSVTRTRRFDIALTGGFRPTASPPFRSIESHRCMIGRRTRTTQHGPVLGPLCGRPLKSPLQFWARALSPTDLCSDGSSRIGS